MSKNNTDAAKNIDGKLASVAHDSKLEHKDKVNHHSKGGCNVNHSSMGVLEKGRSKDWNIKV